jgi:hypothetical protein
MEAVRGNRAHHMVHLEEFRVHMIDDLMKLKKKFHRIVSKTILHCMLQEVIIPVCQQYQYKNTIIPTREQENN